MGLGPSRQVAMAGYDGNKTEVSKVRKVRSVHLIDAYLLHVTELSKRKLRGRGMAGHTLPPAGARTHAC